MVNSSAQLLAAHPTRSLRGIWEGRQLQCASLDAAAQPFGHVVVLLALLQGMDLKGMSGELAIVMYCFPITTRYCNIYWSYSWSARLMTVDKRTCTGIH